MRPILLLVLLGLAFSGCDCTGAAAHNNDDDDDDDDDADAGPSPDAGIPAGDLLDTGFGEGGVARGSGTWSTDKIYAAARAADGRITVGGTTSDVRGSQALVGRFTAAGQADSTFGAAGHIKISLFDSSEVTDLVVLEDGAVVLSGTTYYPRGSQVFAARLSADGALDPSFGDGGLVLWEGLSNGLVVVAADEDGRVRVVSDQSSGGALLQCLNADGSLDTEVELDGDEPRAVLVLEGGAVLALTTNSDTSFLQRLNADCGPDASFADGGSYAFDFPADDVAVDPAGSDLLIAGAQLVKLTAQGTLDESFVAGSGGRAVAWLPSGDIFLVDAAGNSFPGLAYQALIRLDENGASLPFDNTPTSIFSDESAHLLAGPDGVFLVSSEQVSSDTPAREDSRMSVLSLAADGVPSTDFGSAGLAQLATAGGSELGWDMVRQSDGAVVVAATAGGHGTLMRFVDGALDPTFGVDGFVRHYFRFIFSLREDGGGGFIGLHQGGALMRLASDGSADASFVPDVLPGPIRDLALDASGRIVVTGGVYGDGIDVYVLLARYDANGTLDGTFGEGGVVQGLDGNSAYASSVFVDDNGAIVISGEYYPSGEIFCARFTEDGALDGDFGVGGVTTLGGMINEISRIRARSAGGYLIATRSALGQVIDVSAVDSAGAVVESFGTDGLASVTAAGDGPFDMLELADGRILVSKSLVGVHALEMVVWGLRADGQLDATFGDNGRFVFPGQGHAVRLLADGDGVLVGGYRFHPATGTDVALLRITP